MSYKTWHDFDSWDQVTGDNKKGQNYEERYLKQLGTYYGLNINEDRFNPQDRGSQETFDPDDVFLKETLRRANNDYDFRRAQEAARLSAGDVKYQFGDKKWSEMTDDEREGLKREEHMANKEAEMIPSPRFANVPSSISNLENFFNANKFMKDTYVEEGLDDKEWKGNFGKASQRAAVKDYYVDLDANSSKSSPDTDEPESTTPLSDEYAQKGAPLSDEAQQAQDLLSEHVNSIKDGSFNDSWRRKPSTAGTSSANDSYARKQPDTQVNNAMSGIHIDNVGQKRNQTNQMIEDSFREKMYGGANSA